MNREIKFRAWEKHAKRMAEVTTFKWQPDHLYHQVYTQAIVNEKMIDEWYAYDFGGDSNGIILMQYTGEKDKDGKEIYEGDIVKYFDNKEHIVVVENIKELGTGMYLKRVGSGYYTLNPSVIRDYEVEVIGDIHNNPELLEVV